MEDTATGFSLLVYVGLMATWQHDWNEHGDMPVQLSFQESKEAGGGRSDNWP